MRALWITPRDGFFCKDGRGWYTSASNRAHALDWPMPTTLRGALRGAFGRQQEARLGQPLTSGQWDDTDVVHLGANLPVRAAVGASPTAADRLWPTPADAWYGREALVERIEPIGAAGATHGIKEGTTSAIGTTSGITIGRSTHAEHGTARRDPIAEAMARPNLPRHKPGPRPRWWTEGEFCAWLDGQPIGAGEVDDRKRQTPAERRDVRVAIDRESSSAAESQLFSSVVREAIDQDGQRWSIAVRATWPEALPDVIPMMLGGDRRLARLAPIDDAVFASPKLSTGDSPGLRVFVITPAEFKRGWLPDGFKLENGRVHGKLDPVGEVVLRAAFVGRPLSISGWDLEKRAPKQIRRLVPPGAVYFFTRPDGRPFTAAERLALWWQGLGKNQEDGQGQIVAGPWMMADVQNAKTER
ncbi:MAG: hypothetical protein KC620_01885 [Myxococcales bacterium]|nr:hypothetical protein [Myxococcales bacterium]